MKNGVFHAPKEIEPTTTKKNKTKQKMGGNKQIISFESTVLWTQPSCIAHCSVEFLLHLIGFGGLDLALVVEKGEVCKKVEIIMYTTMRKRRAWPWKVLVRDYIKEYRKMRRPFFFPIFIVCILMESNGKNTFLHLGTRIGFPCPPSQEPRGVSSELIFCFV